MTGWDVSPSGVQGALQKTAVSAGEMSTAGNESGEPHRTATAAGTVASGYTGPELATGPVAAALGEFMQHKPKELRYIVARTGKSLTGAAEARNEYVKGDLRMAATGETGARNASTTRARTGPDGKPSKNRQTPGERRGLEVSDKDVIEPGDTSVHR